MDSSVQPDVVHDLEVMPVPFVDEEFDCILGSHVFEHVIRLPQLVVELHRILKPGGYLIAVTPYGSSDDAWDCPHHVRSFSENTWAYFCDQLYELKAFEHASNGARQGCKYGRWTIEETALIPYAQFIGDAEIEFKARHWRNVIKELQVVLRKAD